MSDKKLNLVFCWHMHQPWYRESLDGDYHLPWVYLHALKDYTDMAGHLEANPGMKCVINFTPVLLEQIDDYAAQCRNWLDHASRFSDPLLNYLSGEAAIPSAVDERIELIKSCLRAHEAQMIDPYPAFRFLVDEVSPDTEHKHFNTERIAYLGEQYFHDLLTWYHLAWLGYSVKQLPLVQGLITKARFFTAADRRQLISVFADILDHLIARYRTLAERQQIELSMTPYAHPIMPLLIDFDSMGDTLPEAPRPVSGEYPGGQDRALWHMQQGLAVFEHYFACRPSGVWLSEGAVSEAAVRLLDRFDIAWTASGEGVWHNSSYLSGIDVNRPETRQNLFRCNHLPDSNTRIFFRDDGLSDLIGFEYQQWNADDAAADFLGHMTNISTFLEHAPGDHVVSVILDGENAWEYYPDNAHHFISTLYQQLVQSDDINLLTFSEAVAMCPPQILPKLCAGSWVYGSFSTWIGEEEKNRGWDLLVDAKQVFDRRIGQLDDLQKQQATLQLAICEGSDWFWWFGDYNPEDSVSDFDQLFRLQLQRLYELLDEPVPDTLSEPVSSGGGTVANAGTMRRGHE